MLDLALAQQCSPQVDPVIAHTIVKTESSFNPFAIGVNRGSRVHQPTSYAGAVATAKRLLKDGANIDLGYAQINSANLSWLGLSVEQVFDPCTNLRAMQTVYKHCYARAGENGIGTRIQRAFSCYNTGNMEKGFRNGYVTKATKNYNHFMAYNFSNKRPVIRIVGRSNPNPNPNLNPSLNLNPKDPLPTNAADLARLAEDLQVHSQSNAINYNSESVDLERVVVPIDNVESDVEAGTTIEKPKYKQGGNVFALSAIDIFS